MKRGLAVALLAAAVAAHAESWTEYRRVSVEAGKPRRVVLEDTVVVVGGDTAAVGAVEGRTLVLAVSDTRERRIDLMRAVLGPLVLIIGPAAKTPALDTSTPPAAVAVEVDEPERPVRTVTLDPEPVSPSGAPATSYSAPVVSISRPNIPPIAEPPRPLVLTTPPAVGATSPSAATAANATGASAIASVTVLPSSPAAPPSPSAPRAVVEREVPRASTLAPDTSALAGMMIKPAEMALYTLAEDLLARGLYGDAIQQYRRLLAEFPRSNLKEMAMMRLGSAFKMRAEMFEKESFRQRDLRRSGAANDALTSAIEDFDEAIDVFRELTIAAKTPSVVLASQLEVARSLHGLVRAQFEKGGASPTDSPAVVVEYLRSFVGGQDTTNAAAARLGIAQYYRDLGDARLASRMDRKDIHEAYDRAIEEYVSLVASDPVSSSAEEALIDLGRLHDRNLEMRQFEDAVRYYELLTNRFPASPHAEEARSRARWIRENYL